MNSSLYIQPEEVRAFIMDRTPADNPLADGGPDLFFTDPEITQAMRFMVMKYNSIPPRGVDCITPEAIPLDEAFFQGIAASLLRSKLHQMMRNDYDYQAGGASFDIQKRRIDNFQKLLADAENEFKTGALYRKKSINNRNFWRHL